MKKCELCGKEHEGLYGSGRFCSSKCARSFSTSKNRKEINEKVSRALHIRSLNNPNSRYNKKLQKEKERVEKINEYLLQGYIYLRYPNINFSRRYLINNKGNIISTKTLNQISTSYKKDKYVRVNLKVDGKQYLLYVHRLVAYNFIPNPENLPLVNHKDENPKNNDFSNLEWCTTQYNNTYNNLHIRKGKKLKGKIPWNKGLKIKK